MLALAALAGCTRLSVDSTPPGAKVLWSRDGTEPYQTWPPNSWEISTSANGGVTPFRSTGSFGDTIFVTVEIDGYRRPLPKPVELYLWRNEKLKFDMKELPETMAARKRAEGLVYYNGAWVDPKAANLATFNGVVMPAKKAYELEQRSKGLVPYGEEWVTPAAALERQRADYTAKGLVEFKGRWLAPEASAIEGAIDEEVAIVRDSGDFENLSAPKLVGSINQDNVQLQLYNSTGQKIRFLVSGPVSLERVIDSYRSAGVRADDKILLPAGRYELAVLPTGTDAAGRDLTQLLGLVDESSGVVLSTTPQYAAWPLSAKQQYSFNYTGGSGSIQDGMNDFEVTDPQPRKAPPEITIPEVRIPEPPARPDNREGGPRRPDGSQRPTGQQGGGQGRNNGGGQRNPQATPAATTAPAPK
ncbi:hypothetical protein BH09SUM1_BH09SUM1_13720 [soil metagenome]